MNILFVGPLPEPVTGQSLACRVLLDELSRHHEVRVVNLSKREFKQGVSSLSRVLTVMRIICDVGRKSRTADIIYLTVAESFAGNLKDLMIYIVCFRRLQRTVIHLHGGAGLRGIMLGPKGLHRRVNEFFVRRLGGAIVLGSRQVDVFSQALSRDRIHIVPNFAQDYLFVSDERISQKFAHMRPLRLLFLSNLLPGKGYRELVEAFLALDEPMEAAVEIDFAGSFESEADRALFLQRIERSPHLRYHGTVHGEQKRALFERTHVFCLPTYYPYEGQPISILEAYASGCAVMTTDHSGIGDIFADGINGYEVEKRSSRALKYAIEKALGNPEHLKAMALGNASLARREYQTAKYTASLIRILECVA